MDVDDEHAIAATNNLNNSENDSVLGKRKIRENESLYSGNNEDNIVVDLEESDEIE